MADKYIISKTKMTAIADAIRTKTGGTAALTADQMATAISNLSIGTTDEAATWCKSAILGTLSGGVTIPDDITTMPKYIFSGNTAITSINLNKLTTVPQCFLESATALTSITLTSSQTLIDENAFSGTQITSLTIPEGSATVTINENAFYDCARLTVVDFKAPVNVKQGSFSWSSSSMGNISMVTFEKDSTIDMNAFSARKGKIACYTSGTTIESGAFDYYHGDLYVPRAYLTTYKEATNWAAYASRIYPIPKYISYAAPDGTYVIVNADDGIQTSSPLSSTYDSTSLTFVNPSYDTTTKTVDLSSTDYFATYALGSVTMTQSNPQVTFSIPDGATGAITYDGITITQTSTSGTYRIATGSSVSYTVKLSGYKNYSGTLITTGADTISITTSDLTARTQTSVDIVKPFSDTSELGNLVDGTNWVISTSQGAIESGSASYNVGNGSSFGYITIITPSSETALSITYHVSSESNFDFGYVILTDTQTQCAAYSSYSDVRSDTTTTDLSSFTTGTKYLLIKESGDDGSVSNTVTFTLPANKTLYLGFGYIKDSSGNTNDDRMYIYELKYTTMK